MMKLNYKIRYFYATIGMIVFSLSVPFISAAQSPVPSTRGICSRISVIRETIDQNIIDRESDLAKRRIKRDALLLEKQVERDAKLSEARIATDSRLGENLEKLQGRADTEEKKVAVESFINAITLAKDSRREDVNSAFRAYKTGLQRILNSRETDVDRKIASFKLSVETAIEKASSDCQAGVDPRSVATTIEVSLRTTRETLVSDKKAIGIFRTSLETLTLVRKAAIETAKARYVESVEKAKVDLKESLSR